MQRQRLFSLHNPWFTSSVIISAAIAVVAGAFGFIWLPLMERNASFPDVWTAICSAAGVPQPAPGPGAVVQPAVTLSHVILTPGMVRPASAEAIGRGGTLALRCSMCHGARGLSQADSPNLAGQYTAAVYKQLQDFKSGARASVVMAPLVGNLSTRDMRELGDYYAYLPRPPWLERKPAPQIVESGAPMRGIAPCGTCHGQEAHKLGTPWLEGEPVAYLRTQLLAFKAGQRHNDISGIMRNIVRQMTNSEIDAAAQFYGEQP